MNSSGCLGSDVLMENDQPPKMIKWGCSPDFIRVFRGFCRVLPQSIWVHHHNSITWKASSQIVTPYSPSFRGKQWGPYHLSRFTAHFHRETPQTISNWDPHHTGLNWRQCMRSSEIQGRLIVKPPFKDTAQPASKIWILFRFLTNGPWIVHRFLVLMGIQPMNHGSDRTSKDLPPKYCRSKMI